MRTFSKSFSIPSHSTPLYPTASFSLPISCALFFSKPLGRSLLCCQYMCECKMIYWNKGNLSGAAYSKKTNPSLLSSHLLLIASQLGVGLHEPVTHPCWGFGGLILCRSHAYIQRALSMCVHWSHACNQRALSMCVLTFPVFCHIWRTLGNISF